MIGLDWNWENTWVAEAIQCNAAMIIMVFLIIISQFVKNGHLSIPADSDRVISLYLLRLTYHLVILRISQIYQAWLWAKVRKVSCLCGHCTSSSYTFSFVCGFTSGVRKETVVRWQKIILFIVKACFRFFFALIIYYQNFKNSDFLASLVTFYTTFNNKK